MPYKFNEPRRHKIPTAKYRVTNWPDYDAALVRRGALTVWFTDEAIAAWRAPATGRRGGQPIYSTLAIETALTIRQVFHQPLRQTEGLLRSIADVLGVDIAIPDHTTLMWTAQGWQEHFGQLCPCSCAQTFAAFVVMFLRSAEAGLFLRPGQPSARRRAQPRSSMAAGHRRSPRTACLKVASTTPTSGKSSASIMSPRGARGSGLWPPSWGGYRV